MDNKPTTPPQSPVKSSVSSYLVGYGLSLALTLGAYSLVQIHLKSGHIVPTDQILLYLLAALAIIQLFAQLVFFLRLNRESKPRLNVMLLLFAALVVVVIVGGSMWIMSNLSYNMSPSQANDYIIKDESIHL